MTNDVASYPNFINEYIQEKGTIKKAEHNASFLVAQVLHPTNSLGTVKEYSYYVVAIVSGRQLNLGVYFCHYCIRV